LKSGLNCRTIREAAKEIGVSLNPFEIRAELPRGARAAVRGVEKRLNPFEIRAELPRRHWRNAAAAAVSIPLKSGLNCRLTNGAESLFAGLNPFEIRAELPQKEHDEHVHEHESQSL